MRTLNESEQQQLNKLNLADKIKQDIKSLHIFGINKEAVSDELKALATDAVDELERNLKIKITALDPLIVGIAIVDSKNPLVHEQQ